MSAYACEPGLGSEPGVGWNTALEMVRYHDVWVMTRANNRRAVEAALRDTAIPGLHFVYYDLPRWACWWKRGQRGVQVFYYLWQVGAYFVARRLHRQVGFDLIHHVTFVRYWMPCFLALLPVPLIWGPVGGGETTPKAFWRTFSFEGKVCEALREIGRWLGERDPFVRLTARRSVLAMAATEETQERLRRLGTTRTRVVSQIGLRAAEIDQLARCASPDGTPLRFVGIGRLLWWKGFQLGLRAFALARVKAAEFWIIGDGPERGRLAAAAQALGIADRVVFWGRLSRAETLRKLGQTHVMVHPSLHDSGGWVCLEALAAGRPVICLDLGGPANQISSEVGFKIPAHDPDQAVNELAKAMRLLAADPGLRERMGDGGAPRSQAYCWKRKGELFNTIYWQAMQSSTSNADALGQSTHAATHSCE